MGYEDSLVFATLLYTGEVSNHVKDVAMLVYAADKFELKGLLEICSTKLKTGMEDDELVDILILSYRHNLADFKRLALERIMANKARFIDNS